MKYSHVPTPAHRIKRREALPWEHPKPLAEDSDAERRQRAIMRDPSYIEADRDTAFLDTDAMRGVRLQLDYLKAETALAAQDIRRCVLVFGSTRLREPESARREVTMIQAEAAAHPDDARYQAALKLAERRLELSKYYNIGREFGRLAANTARQHKDSHFAIMTGGGPGGMEAANRGAFEAGAKTIGLNITLPREQFPNPYITPGLCFQFHYFALRKLHFMKRAVAIVALPGGFGTMDELFGALTLIQTRKSAPIPIILVGKEYWTRAFDVDFLYEWGSIDSEDRDLFWYAETAQEAWDGVRAWHAINKTPLFEGDEQLLTGGAAQ